MHAKQHRPIRILDQEFLMKTLDAGLELKLDSPDAPKNASSVSVVHWFESLASTMELLGLDTVFCVPTPTWSDEHYLLKDWGRIDEAVTKPWAQSLCTGVLDPHKNKLHPPCPHDAQNLFWVGTLILNSLTPTHRHRLNQALGQTPCGLKLITWIVHK